MSIDDIVRTISQHTGFYRATCCVAIARLEDLFHTLVHVINLLLIGRLMQIASIATASTTSSAIIGGGTPAMETHVESQSQVHEHIIVCHYRLTF